MEASSVDRGWGWELLKSLLLKSLAGDLGPATQTLQNPICLVTCVNMCKMETAPAYFIDS